MKWLKWFLHLHVQDGVKLPKLTFSLGDKSLQGVASAADWPIAVKQLISDHDHLGTVNIVSLHRCPAKWRAKRLNTAFRVVHRLSLHEYRR